MRLASGICPTIDLTDAGALFGLGVDGSASNDASNMILEARQALYIQRLRYGAEKITRNAAGLGHQRLGQACWGVPTSVSWRRASRPTWRCSSSTSCASPAAMIRSALLLCGAPTRPTG
jgi:8-oxoguanine deaminase